MAQHRVSIKWVNEGPDFLRRLYSREHTWHFDGGAVVAASPSPLVVPAPWSNAENVDPEEAFVASVASCHMLWFLHVAVDAGWLVTSYEDAAIGTMVKDANGKLWISRIVLRPKIVWGGPRVPDAGEVHALHHRAHKECFIANSIKTEVVVEPWGGGTFDEEK
ncbi:OsmC family peroxiredoxin [Phragmitibacter flavus]|uniref:OsmC family peroxiredoxin n=1 Tax=Phragmitibacter flavus TaxID=2576071 RepID=A0A5R8KC66_9BACT|nr:OsmC family protein [Phragmitibacter flavus]TLD69892.1 OsmC family peroxiredoxin [Phragmitibacter flavus]